jgi:hypothetical protein
MAFLLSNNIIFRRFTGISTKENTNDKGEIIFFDESMKKLRDVGGRLVMSARLTVKDRI